MKLGLSLGYSGAHLNIPIEKVQLAERLGYDSVWTAEAYGSDAITPLAFIAAHTERIRLGTGIIQLAGRTPANAAMAIATLDALAGGNRAICGIGVSGPQIVEGWYGQPWGRPYYRIKDYVSIMKKIWAREEPVTHEGKEFNLPFTGEGALGIGKPLKSILHTNPDIPIWLGTGMESTVRLTAEIADGWLPLGFVPETANLYDTWITEGLEKGGKTPDQFERQAGTQVQVTNDVKSALDRAKPGIALYVGGMGHKTKNFHNEMMIRRGYPEAAARIQELYLAKRKDEAIAAVPDEFVDEGALIGPKERIKKRFRDWEDSGLTGLTISGNEDALRLMAECARLNF
ncbi:MAG: LLM class F420-dependent oxidoreductase [Gammaproteobacteria bacterium]|nr:MAG: LLM class F420-dependent oxidoreductase [Gammaproteobacteria bacterium]